MPKQPEKKIENQILMFLEKFPNIVAWKNNNAAIFDAKKKVYRKPVSRFQPKGIPDIIGYCKTREKKILPLFIEVKTPTGRATPEQREFLLKASQFGCIAIIARSVEETLESLIQFGVLSKTVKGVSS